MRTPAQDELLALLRAEPQGIDAGIVAETYPHLARAGVELDRAKLIASRLKGGTFRYYALEHAPPRRERTAKPKSAPKRTLTNQQRTHLRLEFAALARRIAAPAALAARYVYHEFRNDPVPPPVAEECDLL
jgi:hypothetical protein